MPATGKARSSEPLGRANLTLAAMQVSRTDDGVAEVQAQANLATTPIYSVHDLPAHAVITDPAHTYRLDGCRIEIIGRRACCGHGSSPRSSQTTRGSQQIQRRTPSPSLPLGGLK